MPVWDFLLGPPQSGELMRDLTRCYFGHWPECACFWHRDNPGANSAPPTSFESRNSDCTRYSPKPGQTRSPIPTSYQILLIDEQPLLCASATKWGNHRLSSRGLSHSP